jgi:16S rRNA (adenine1518-N6/adenine1519-N6)-dimethyltransferase
MPKKHLGQHFLTSPAYAQRIAEAVPATRDEAVLEIGPGHGALSRYLVERFPAMHLVEVDDDAATRLKQKLGEGSYTLHIADVMKFEFSKAGFPLHVVGNLPYSIGALIIKKTLLYGDSIRSCTFMVQREVAERIVSARHKKTNGFLALFCQYFGDPRILFHVPPGSFFPRPKIDSSVFQLVVDPIKIQRLPREKWEVFFAFVSRGFGMRRKKLSNTITENGEERKRCESILADMGQNPLSRPEDLGIEEWLTLYRLWERAE